MSDWRDMESAPRDGTALLLFCPGMNSWNRKPGMPDIVVGLWEPGKFHIFPGGWYSDVGDIEGGYESTGSYFEHEPIHPVAWMPLPAPPETRHG